MPGHYGDWGRRWSGGAICPISGPAYTLSLLSLNMVFSKYTYYLLLLIAGLVWIGAISYSPNLKIIACDVGQGDAILIEKGTDQILIDGGPNNKVLDCLGRYMPFWDRSIELVILTHPDSDHSSGLLSIFDRYQVQTMLTNDLEKEVFSTQLVDMLKSKVGGSGTRVVLAHSDQGLRLGLIYLDILHPDQNFEDTKTNNYSIVTLLKYAEFEAIFTGDIEKEVSDLV